MRNNSVTIWSVRQKRGIATIHVLLMGLAFCLIVADLGYFQKIYVKQKENVIDHVTIETGSDVTLDMFIRERMPGCSFITDVSLIDTMVPGSYQLRVRNLGRPRDVYLDVVDTTHPSATAVPQVIFQDDLPDASSTVTDITDLASVFVSYDHEMTVPLEGGVYDVPVRLTDASGNVTIINVPFDVTADVTAPSLSVPECVYGYVGDTISYMNEVTVTDDFDPSPSVEVNLDSVDLETPGVYSITYVATDAHGNTSSVPADLILEDMPQVFVDRSDVYATGADVLYNQVLNGEPITDFTDVEIAFRIFNWAHRNIGYTGFSDKSDWTIAALDGFATHTGDCYTYYAVCRTMLDVAGIENVRVERYPVTTSPHYWNLIKIDGQWYHCDACDFSDVEGYVFMQIDEELDYHHEFNAATIPTVSSVSVQDRLDFTNLTMTEE
ncbi:MAG: hypothetical protein K6F79_06555 [Saccharofermentans sp.]|nr:hypothetical protein [Saccharofermentans sp.]